ncbi:MAG: ParB/RepB/Spo0J family partition protein, partial [Proteobacteria bacterium]|nr:ParB/RepB/Spo0J family partition protein [Pseudomonadota bacterium]
MTANKRGLGRGLSALLGEQDEVNAAQIAAQAPAAESAIIAGSTQPISVNAIQAGKFQPRTIFRDDELAELSASIKKNGVVQPIIVRKIANANVPYEIVAGERRFRASKLAGLAAIPAIVIDVDDKQALEIALVENIQRRDLAATEVAKGYQRLMNEFSYTQEELAEVLGKSRS